MFASEGIPAAFLIFLATDVVFPEEKPIVPKVAKKRVDLSCPDAGKRALVLSLIHEYCNDHFFFRNAGSNCFAGNI
jgi:hypothetical protein